MALDHLIGIAHESGTELPLVLRYSG